MTDLDVARRSTARFLRLHDRPRELQESLLREIVSRNRDTVFGRAHGFGEIRTPADFRRQVPIQGWKSLEPLVDRVCRGEPYILTQEPVVLFHQTSGTTGKNKLIPVTARCNRLQARGYRTWVHQAMLDNPGMLAERVVGIVSANLAGKVDCGIPFGYVSGNVFTTRMPSLVRRAYAFPYEVIEIPDPEARRYTLMRLALQQPCSFSFTGNPGALLLLFELAERRGEEIIRDIHDGGLACAEQVPGPILVKIRRCLARRPDRARVLAALRNAGGRLRPSGYWPGLALVACWLGGTVGRFASQLGEWVGQDTPVRDVGYMSSEGTFTIPLANGMPAGLLTLDSTFFEFVPCREFGRPGATALMAHEVEDGAEYQVVLTTTGGLYRYAINDIVRVVGKRGDSPFIQFVQKGENVKNLAGEMLNADQVLSAIATATAAMHFSYRHVQVHADQSANRYVFHFEPFPANEACPPGSLAEVLERELGRASEMYLGFREESALGACAVRYMRTGWFDGLVSSWNAQGMRESQFKAALLVDRVDGADMVDPRYPGGT